MIDHRRPDLFRYCARLRDSSGVGSCVECEEAGIEEGAVLAVVEDEIGEEDEVKLLLRLCRVRIDRKEHLCDRSSPCVSLSHHTRSVDEIEREQRDSTDHRCGVSSLRMLPDVVDDISFNVVDERRVGKVGNDDLSIRELSKDRKHSDDKLT